MGTGTSRDIKATIIGRLDFDYADNTYLPDIVKADIEALCARYNLDLEWKES